MIVGSSKYQKEKVENQGATTIMFNNPVMH